jgi:hypothetical protein
MSEEEFEVEEIFGHRQEKNKLKLRIKWLKYSYNEDTWEPYENMLED